MNSNEPKQTDQTAKEKQRKRRKRVARIRSGIITFMTLWIILSIAVITMLCFKVVSLQDQLNYILQNYTFIPNDSTEETDSTIGEDTSSLDEDEVLEEDLSILVSQSLNAESNLAEEGDILKVYLTFDDGPSDNTDAILDILDDYSVKATFFVIGKTDDDSIAAYQRIVDEGHTLGMHSYTHVYSQVYATMSDFQSDLSSIHDLLYEVTGVDCRYYRFPGGSSNRVSNVDMLDLIEYLNAESITYFDWNVASGDATANAYTADELVENVLSDVVKYKTSVVLMHDASNKEATVEALPAMIEGLQELGAVLLPIDETTTLIQHSSVQ